MDGSGEAGESFTIVIFSSHNIDLSIAIVVSRVVEESFLGRRGRFSFFYDRETLVLRGH